MDTKVISSDHPDAISSAAQTLSRGGLVAFPTDTVYGVAALISDFNAINDLFTAKGRDFNKAIAVLIGAPGQIAQVAESFSPSAQRLVERFWPGALTVVVTRRPDLPANLSQLPTVGVRMPDHAFARQLLTAVGPLATTSANQSGKANPITAQDVLAQLGGRIDLVLDGGPCPGGVPSTVVDCTLEPPTILRQGAISEADIRAVLG